MTYRIGTAGASETVHMYAAGDMPDPRALCGRRAGVVLFDRSGTLRPSCRACLNSARARREREAAARRYGRYS